jgi:hypothetical protein
MDLPDFELKSNYSHNFGNYANINSTQLIFATFIPPHEKTVSFN